ncbi:MAG TPA: hypothetical protein VEO54_17705 [Thermoanaerobaculia bacterium]|nr:hypothetical protein [Thermoanaerobaculia bacterium]
MKHHRFASLMIAAALALPAFGATSLLTPDGVRYAIEPNPETPQVEIARAEGQQRARLVVPSTQDVAFEYDAQLAYDTATSSLFVVWSREGYAGSEVRYARLNERGEWSSPRLITAGAGAYRGLQFVLTHPAGDEDVTLLHAAWWSLNGVSTQAEYALFAFENGRFISGDVQDLESLSAIQYDVEASEYEDTGTPLHPALALERNGDSVDVVFGSTTSTRVTRFNVGARKVGPNVRIWKPVGRTGNRTQRALLTSTDPNQPVYGLIRKGNIALYTISEDFRFTVLRNDGSWSPVREVRIDEDNTAEDLLRELQRTVEELEGGDPVSSEEALASR